MADGSKKIWFKNSQFISILDLDKKRTYKIFKTQCELKVGSNFFMDIATLYGSSTDKEIALYSIEHKSKTFSAIKQYRFTESSLNSLL